MSDINYYLDPAKFVNKVITDMKLGAVAPAILTSLKEAITLRLADRILGTVIDSFSEKELKSFENFLNEHPELDEMDALFVTAQEVPDIDDKLRRNIESLYRELTYDADMIEKSLEYNKIHHGK